jgi:hypothetical protein
MKIALLFLCLVQDDPLAAELLKDWRHAWAGFPEGSLVTYKRTLRQPEISNDGELVYRELNEQESWIVQGTEAGRIMIKMVRGEDSQEIPHHATPPPWFRGKGERKPDEDVAVGGKKLSCRVTQFLFDADKDAGQRTTVWRSAGSPSWAVRLKVETLARGAVNTSTEELLVVAEEKVKAGDQEVVCHVVEVTVQAGASRTVHREWRSDLVPGRIVRRETRFYQGEKENGAARSQMEVVNFRGRK